MSDNAAFREAIGVDMGMHVILARVEKVTLNTTGQYADCTILENGDPILAKDAPLYAGNGFGIYRKLGVGTVVVILCSGGNPDGQNSIVGVLHNNKNAVPTEAIAASDDFWLVMSSGKNIQFKATGAGRIILNGNSRVTGGLSAGTLAADNGTTGALIPVYNDGTPGQLAEVSFDHGIVTAHVVVPSL